MNVEITTRVNDCKMEKGMKGGSGKKDILKMNGQYVDLMILDLHWMMKESFFLMISIAKEVSNLDISMEREFCFFKSGTRRKKVFL